MKVLVTGGAGFIGSHTTERLLRDGHDVAILDCFNDYYNPAIKRANIRAVQDKIQVFEDDLRDGAAVDRVISTFRPDAVIHLAARAGVRPSIEQPELYIDTNIKGTFYLLEACRKHGCKRFVFASSSSVYGVNKKVPFAEDDAILQTISPYAMTKMAGEQICSNYSQLYGIRTVCLRFFTVYGPWGRPDMAPILFAKAIAAGEPIKVFNHGEMWRDFTYVDDIVDGVLRALDRPASGSPPHAVYNLGNNKSEKLIDFIGEIEKALGKTAQMVMAPMQPGDVPATWADIDASTAALGYHPATPISVGIPKFVDWFREYYRA